MFEKLKKFLGYRQCWCCACRVKTLKKCSYGRCEAPCCSKCLNKEGLCKECEDDRTSSRHGNLTSICA